MAAEAGASGEKAAVDLHDLLNRHTDAELLRHLLDQGWSPHDARIAVEQRWCCDDCRAPVEAALKAAQSSSEEAP